MTASLGHSSHAKLPEASPILQFLTERLEDEFWSVWFERVSSEANIADGPSRDNFDGHDQATWVSLDLEALVQCIAIGGQSSNGPWQ